MKKIYIFALASLLVGSLTQLPVSAMTPAVNDQTNTLLAARSASSTDYDAILARIKTNVPVIIAQVKILTPKVQQLAASSATGGWSAFLSAFISGAMDKTIRDAVSKLISILRGTTSDVVAIASADEATKQKAKSALSALRDDKDVQSLLENAKQIPFVGSKLNELLGDSAQL